MTFSQIYNCLTYVSIFSVGVPLLAIMIKFRVLNNVLRTLFIFLLFCSVSDVVCLIYFDSSKLLNTFLNCFGVIETLLILYIYRIKLNCKKAVSISIAVFLIVSTWRFLIQNKYSVEDSMITPIEAILIVTFSGVYIYKFLNTDDIVEANAGYFFWINFSFLLYFGAGLLLFAANDFINHAPIQIASVLWSLHLLINIICNILFATGTWKIQR